MDSKIAIIGGGPMGLTAAYELLKKGYKVELFEQDEILGGMSAHFDFGGLDIEKFYHFVCGPDYPMFELMKELNIFDKLKWTETKMGLFYEGKLYKWGGPFELLAFPKANLMEKARYGLHVFFASKIKNWQKFDDITAHDWIVKWEKEKGYMKFWDSLFQLKFYEIKNTIAAPWLWSRLARVAKSRKSIFQEKMGYVSGGSVVVVDALQKAVARLGGEIHVSSPVEQVLFNDEDGSARAIRVNGEEKPFDAVVSTVPIQYVSEMAKGLPKDDLEKLSTLDNVGVVCVITKLERAFTNNFWLNITDERIDVPGMIEVSNLNTELKDHILYVPFYLHKDNPKYKEPDDVFLKKVREYFKMMDPSMTEDKILDMRVFRYEYAQPVTTTYFLTKLPAMASEKRKGFYMADTAYCYPEDRSITESVRIAHKLVELVSEA